MTVTFIGGMPFTEGKLVGKNKDNEDLTVNKTFLVDTGAGVSGVDAENAKAFKFDEIKGAGPAKSGSGHALTVYQSISMKFMRAKKPPVAPGTPAEEEVTCHLRFVIIPAKRCVLGLDQLKSTGTDFFISVKKGTAELREDP